MILLNKSHVNKTFFYFLSIIFFISNLNAMKEGVSPQLYLFQQLAQLSMRLCFIEDPEVALSKLYEMLARKYESKGGFFSKNDFSNMFLNQLSSIPMIHMGSPVEIPNNKLNFKFHPTKKYLVAFNEDSNLIYINICNYEKNLSPLFPPLCTKISSNIKSNLFLCSEDYIYIINNSDIGTIFIRIPLANPTKNNSFHLENQEISCIACHPLDQNILMAGHPDGSFSRLCFLDEESPSNEKKSNLFFTPFPHCKHGSRVCSIDFSKDGKTLFTSSNNKEVKIWDIKMEENSSDISLHYDLTEESSDYESDVVVKGTNDTDVIVIYYGSIIWRYNLQNHKKDYLDIGINGKPQPLHFANCSMSPHIEYDSSEIITSLEVTEKELIVSTSCGNILVFDLNDSFKPETQPILKLKVHNLSRIINLNLKSRLLAINELNSIKIWDLKSLRCLLNMKSNALNVFPV